MQRRAATARRRVVAGPQQASPGKSQSQGGGGTPKKGTATEELQEIVNSEICGRVKQCSYKGQCKVSVLTHSSSPQPTPSRTTPADWFRKTEPYSGLKAKPKDQKVK